MSTDSAKPFHIPVLGIIGVGMIGGSLALGLKKKRLIDRVIGYGRDHRNLEKAKGLGVIDEAATSAASLAMQSDLVLLATPVGAMGNIMAEIQPVLPTNTILTDVGSVKQSVVDQARKYLGTALARFVPAHPVAGKEKSGVDVATSHLYERHKVVIVPLCESDPDAVWVVEEMWRQLGANIVRMEVEEHDRILAMTSHLPHLLAYAMVHYFAAGADREKCCEMVAGGFYDFTRIASSDPVMWRDICTMNRESILTHIHGYREHLSRLESMVMEGKGPELEALFSAARKARAEVHEKRQQHPSAPRMSAVTRVRQQTNR